ncbi:phage/plasmid primase, P4 family, C-terminal domain-containing protein [Actinomadura meyerae]|uniref:Phage/plasmid primase, P4 family, C-terminal domain-containing protein n=1 Tax=Actinomadura meyerae TaxID=240840 RepID=A0A239JR60_9ACTN|nr:phage/plasmid primase, P4 family [Actinomadura meyerae]SNT08337.1 phage/plasmid primase, P4 family, C-terminal domain-containing protein [Actinomadura meyerae]
MSDFTPDEQRAVKLALSLSAGEIEPAEFEHDMRKLWRKLGYAARTAVQGMASDVVTTMLRDDAGNTPAVPGSDSNEPSDAWWGAMAVETAPIDATDTANGGQLINTAAYADATVRLTGDKLRFVPGFGWFEWTGTHWASAPDRYSVAFSAIDDTAGEFRARGMTTQSRLMGVQRHRREIAEAMQYKRDVMSPADRLNAAPRIPFRNGTFNPRNGEFQSGVWYPDDMRTACVNADFDRSADAERWTQFLTEVFPDAADNGEHVMRMLGRALTGDQRHHVFGVWYGHKGRNGKGTITRLMQHLLGSAVVMPDVRLFERRGQAHGEQLARLALAWLVIANETNEGVAMDDELVKRMSGNDSMNFRRNYLTEVEYAPRYTVVFTTNHLPEFTGTDDALWTRLRAVEFPVSFAGREDVDLDERLKGEADGIATGIALAAHRAYAEGLPDTASTAAAKQKHREGIDPLSQLEGEVFGYAEGARMKTSEFNAALQEWRRANGESRTAKFAPKQIKAALERQGVKVVTGRGTRYFAGIAAPSGPVAEGSGRVFEG